MIPVLQKLRNAKIPLKVWLWTAVLGFTVAYTVYLTALQTPLLSKREFFFALLVWVLACCVILPILNNHLLPAFQKMDRRKRLTWSIISTAFGIFLLGVTGKPAISIWVLPKHELSISRVEGRDPRSSGDVIQVGWINTGLSDISFSSLGLEGDWQRDGDALLNTGEDPATLNWQGRVGRNAVVLFTARPDGGMVTFSWDGKDQIINLYSPEPKALPVEQEFIVPFFNRLLGAIAIGITSAFIFLAITLFLLKLDPAKEVRETQGRWTWLLYAVPMLLIWALFLATFWPGMMSRDSFDQWAQVISGQFTDGHPAFHTMFIWLITRIWDTPAAVAIAQMLFLSLVSAWGIDAVTGLGLSRKRAWWMAGLFAVSPVNAIFSITLWKDVAYSTGLFLFSLQLLKIIISKGKWLDKNLNWISIGIVAALVSLFRHNGLPVVAASLVFLAIFYRHHWRRIVLSLGLLILLYFGVKGPLYDWLKVSPQVETKQVVFLHHIAAHIDRQSVLLPEERQVLDQIQPVEDWKYDCCAITRTYYDPGFNPKMVEEYAGQISEIALGLLLRDPLVDINHWLCAGSLVWRIQTCCPLTTGLFSPHLDSLTWVIPNEFGIEQRSLLPSLVPILTRVYMLLPGTPFFLLIWSPALYLYLSIFAVAILAIKTRNWRHVFFIVPAVLQSAVLFLVNISFQFRYQYSVYLVGLFSLGFLLILIPPITRKRSKSQ